MRAMIRHQPLAVILLALFTVLALPGEAAPSFQSKPVISGKYEHLTAAQQALIQDFASRLNTITERPVTAEELWNAAAISTRTTFEAATQALEASKLTAEDGSSLGDALALVDKLDAVKGRVPGAGGDKQFRLYVRLKPNAMETLKASQEFSRTRDNTVYHKGYPISFRQAGGVPSIQISISKDEQRADIDVDYRSSKFPAGLVNGHLTASNSDVRAGNNYDRHVNRWSGLNNWWRDLFGLPRTTTTDQDEKADLPIFPPDPNAKFKKFEDAVEDFLLTWFVRGAPENAIGYLSEEAERCLELSAAGDVDPGLSRVQIGLAMIRTAQGLGKVSSLADVMQGVRLTRDGLKLIEHPYSSQYALYEVRSDVAEEFDCGNRLDRVELSEKKGKFGDYFGTAFFLQTAEGRGATLLLLWRKEKGYWKIVSYQVEPLGGEQELPDLRDPADLEVRLERIDGDPELLEAGETFVNSWFVRRDYDKALGFFHPRSFPCLNLFLEEGASPISSDEDARQRLRAGMQRVAEELQRTNRLRGLIHAVEMSHPQAKLVSHSQQGAFTLISLPDQLGDMYTCQGDMANVEPPLIDEPTFGNYYAMAFSPVVPGDEAAVLTLLWNRVDGDWKIVAWKVELP